MKNLETTNLLLRKAKLEDVEIMHNKWFSDEKIANELDFKPHKNLQETQIVILSAIKNFETELPVWIIEQKVTHKIIGYIKVVASSKINKRCDILFHISPEYKQKTNTEEALKCVIDYLITKENYETIVSGFYDTDKNITQQTTEFLEEIGMKKEAILRNRRINKLTGEKNNRIVFSILKEDYMKNQEYNIFTEKLA